MCNINSEQSCFNKQLLADLYKTRFKAIAFKLTTYGDIEEAKLIASETFHTIYEKCVKSELPFNTLNEGYAYWLKSATHEAYKQYAARTVRLNEHHASSLLSEDDLDFVSTEDHRIIAEELMKMLQNLEDKYRQVLMYRFWEGLNSYEIGALMGITPELVRQRQKRGLSMLDKNLKDHPGRQLMMGDHLRMLLLLVLLHQQEEINLQDPVTNRSFFPFGNIATTSRENEQA